MWVVKTLQHGQCQVICYSVCNPSMQFVRLSGWRLLWVDLRANFTGGQGCQKELAVAAFRRLLGVSAAG